MEPALTLLVPDYKYWYVLARELSDCFNSDWTWLNNMAMMRTVLMVVLIIGVTVNGQFDPLLNVESCTKDKLTVSTYGATSYGLIYIQGQDENCRQTTQEGLAVYEFDFSTCNIQWEMLFKIIIQKNAGFQTGADKQIPIFCIPDKNDIIVTNDKYTGDASDSAALNKTVRPSAFMTFYKVVSDEEVSGQEVKLTDILIMALQLDTQWTDDFDIKARYCVASDIVIIENFCATDVDLFPNFSKLKTGYLISQFGAFRPTTLEGGAIDMNFTCILEVCQGVCASETCGSDLGWGRKRREVNDDNSSNTELSVTSPDSQSAKTKRAAEDFDLDVGARVKIVEKYSEIQIVTEETLCMNAALFVLIVIILGTGCVVFGSLSLVLYRKWSTAHADITKLTNERSRTKSSPRLHGSMGDVSLVTGQHFNIPFEPRSGGLAGY